MEQRLFRRTQYLLHLYNNNKITLKIQEEEWRISKVIFFLQFQEIISIMRYINYQIIKFFKYLNIFFPTPSLLLIIILIIEKISSLYDYNEEKGEDKENKMEENREFI